MHQNPTPIFYPTSDPTVLKLRLDNSSLEKYQNCARKGLFYLFLRRDVPKSAALNMGAAIHNGLEHQYKHGFTPSTLVEAYNIVTEHYQQNPITDEWRGPNVAIEVIRKYHEQVGTYEDLNNILTHDDQPMVETSFEIELGEVVVDQLLSLPTTCLHPDLQQPSSLTTIKVSKIKIFWTGKIDLAVSHLGAPVPKDHKTGTVFGNSYWDQFPLSSQFLGYRYALQHIIKQRPPGAIINAIKIYKKGADIQFEHQYIPGVENDIEEWVQDTLHTIGDLISDLIKNYFAPTKASCTAKFGRCPYYDVCQQPTTTRSQLLNSSQFTPVTWDPLE